MNKIRVMTFNTQHCLNYLEKRVDYEIMGNVINEQRADIVGLNEMYDKGSIFGEQTKKLSDLTELKNHYFGEACSLGNEGTYGNGFLSRYKIESIKTIIIPDPSPKKYNGYYETRCIIKAKLENGLTVMVVHFGLNPDEQENAVKTIIENLENEKCVLMGDFNITPDNLLLNPIKEKMVDTACLFTDEGLSFPSDKPEIKIDYVFVTPDIKVNYAEVLPIVSSDHRPHIAEIEF
ncbi:MAG: endonuclease/exonuclease/phosphatase family protein [Clostridia bacterium]|nr:endonuclease/exonuclease/phosphatase family protein [Clostridia bacterium]